MNIEEAIKTAIEYETKVRDVYRDAKQKAEDDIGKRVFNVLIQEEQHHLDYLESKLKEWQSDGKLTVEGLITIIPSKHMIDHETNKLQTKLSANKSDKKYSNIELQMLKRALLVEQETSDFYKRMVLELPEDGRELFTRFLEIEEGHKLIVQAEIDAVTGVGYWFDIPEFDLASG